jgi:hydroxyethylthiazole kinase-like uncharacterized protein yjeF
MNQKPRLLYTAAQVRELDRIAIEDHGVDGYVLMCRAGAAAFNLLRARWPHARVIKVFCGSGNNGGDGYVLARLAVQAGLDSEVVAVGRAKSPSAIQACKDYKDAGGRIRDFDLKILNESDLLVDGLLGTGLTKALGGDYAQVARHVNTVGKTVLGLDVPSGLNADTGCIMGDIIRCDATVTFIGAKLGLFTGEGPAVAGAVVFDDLDVPPVIYAGVDPAARIIVPQVDGIGLSRRGRTLHKGLAGRVLIVGGGEGMPGSVRMSAQAAYRVGAGLVQVASFPDHVHQITAGCPEIMAVGVGIPGDLDSALAQADVVAIGPGLGTTEWARALLARVLETRLPLVVDADALNLMVDAEIRRDNWVLTPHPGEAGRLAGIGTSAVQADRPETVAALRNRFGGVIVLKGSGSLVNDGELWLCDRGNPGMASGGMGDVLTGIISGLAAQGQHLSAAARYGVWLHATAADQAALQGGEIGLMATDLLACLRKIINA